MVSIPGLTPATTPVTGFTVAMTAFLLDHTPPFAEAESVMTLPIHVDVGPVMANVVVLLKVILRIL